MDPSSSSQSGSASSAEGAPAQSADKADFSRIYLDVLPVWSGQIDMARAHIEDAALNLVSHFMGISSRMDQIAAVLGSAENTVAEAHKASVDMPAVAEPLDALQESLQSLRAERDAISTEVQRGIVALQFQDRVSQVLVNVRSNLEKLRERVDASGHLPENFDVGAWLDEMLRSYSMIQQREVHEGAQSSTQVGEGDIELF